MTVPVEYTYVHDHKHTHIHMYVCKCYIQCTPVQTWHKAQTG